MNSHAANLWKDHYLDHTPRINELVARKRAPLTAKKPSFDSLRRHRTGDHSLGGPSVSHREHDRSSHAPSSSRRTSATTLYDASPSKSAVKAKQKEKEREKEKPQSKKASTNGAIRVPRRSPTPPDTAIPLKNGYKFSDEDDEYFIKYVNYRLADEPGLSKSDLCAELAAKVGSSYLREKLRLIIVIDGRAVSVPQREFVDVALELPPRALRCADPAVCQRAGARPRPRFGQREQRRGRRRL